ncbi:MAG TPA: hypothetical protein VFL12_04655 [Thermoanaerobaculia bacterium]|nr:hypothetical protein [Thermoanaerobaculia bacterium]
MKKPSSIGFLLLIPAAVLAARSPQPAPAGAASASAPAAATPRPASEIAIYRIELNPTGATFALGEPRPVADGYIYRGLVEKKDVHIPKSMVKAITPLTKDLDHESVWQVDILPSSTVIARDAPKMKSNVWVFHTLKTGTLMSVRPADVKQVTHLTGFAAFKARQQALGASVLGGDLSMEGGTLHVVSSGKEPAPAPAPHPGEGMGWYVVGASEAFPPGNAVVAHPGDVPKAPPPPPPPRR